MRVVVPRTRGAGGEIAAPGVTLAVLGLAAAPAGGGPHRAEEAVSAIRLVWFDPSGLASGSELPARAEAAALLARMGAAVSWRRGSTSELLRSDEVSVVLVGEAPARSDEVVLGATRTRRVIATVVWVRVPNVRAAIGISRTCAPLGLPAIERHLFAVALGRVIAHEVVHAVVPSLPHGNGLMSGRLSRRQLTGRRILVEREAILAFQAALRGDPVPEPRGAFVVAADEGAPERDR